MRRSLKVALIVGIIVSVFPLGWQFRDEGSPSEDDGQIPVTEVPTGRIPSIPRKSLWGVPEENMVEFLKAAERENLYWKYDGITHISFFPRFYELVEEYGGCWEDENDQIHP